MHCVILAPPLLLIGLRESGHFQGTYPQKMAKRGFMMSLKKHISIMSFCLALLPQTVSALGPDLEQNKDTKTIETKPAEVEAKTDEKSEENENDLIVFVPYKASPHELKKYIKGFSVELSEDGTLKAKGKSVPFNLENIKVDVDASRGELSFTILRPDLLDLSELNCKRLTVAQVKAFGSCIDLESKPEKSVFKLNPTNSKNIEIVYENDDEQIKKEALLDSNGKALHFTTQADKDALVVKESKDKFKALLKERICATCSGGKEKLDDLSKLYSELQAHLSQVEKSEYEKKMQELKKKEDQALIAQIKSDIQKKRAHELDSEDLRNKIRDYAEKNPEKNADEAKKLLILLAERKYNDPSADYRDAHDEALSILEEASHVADLNLDDKSIAEVNKKMSELDLRTLKRLGLEKGKSSEEYKEFREEFSRTRAENYQDYGCGTREADTALCNALIQDAQNMKQVDQVATQMGQLYQMKAACQSQGMDPRQCAYVDFSITQLKEKFTGSSNPYQSQNPFLTGLVNDGQNNAVTLPQSGSGVPVDQSFGAMRDPFATTSLPVGSFASHQSSGLFTNPHMQTQQIAPNQAQNSGAQFVNPIQNTTYPQQLLRVR